jgi:hypothetical protein
MACGGWAEALVSRTSCVLGSIAGEGLRQRDWQKGPRKAHIILELERMAAQRMIEVELMRQPASPVPKASRPAGQTNSQHLRLRGKFALYAP